ncbi:MAG: hypothetical protein Q8S73_03180 [Deltaproteobacteria bacterium]|nr:hypothetical protein [Myxococcales bacterium]MDP3213083.1 hypothetical protein [Deltaproteobacteria bacterium]
MRWAFAFVMVVHGLIHLMGFLKAFGLAALPQLARPISRPMGVVWLLAALTTLAAVVALFAWPRGWWLLGAAALLLSQAAVIGAWSDARFGTLANVLLLVGVLYGYLTQGPSSFRAEMHREAQPGLARATAAPVLTEADLAPLPEPVRRYVRAAGFVGQPRVQSYRLRFRGRIRGEPDAAWMPFVADQQSFVDPMTRLFLMHATMFGVPVEAFHRLVGGAATMRVRVAGAYPMVDARGPVMDRSESVTLLNDLCLLAPGALVDPAIAWEPIDDRSARARFTHGANTVAATLVFNDEGLLSDFVSDDRSRSSADGRSFTQLRFSTPVRDYRRYGAFRLASHGDARWHLPGGAFTYGEFDLEDIAYNVGAPR